MTDKSRNFRSSYYDKVGFRGVEEKKSLEILINEKPMDEDKLTKFCLRYPLPAMYRDFVWKVLLGIVPINIDNHKSIMSQKYELYEELENSLKIMGKITEDTPKALIHTLMLLMTTCFIDFNLDFKKPNLHLQNLISLASFFVKFSSSDVDGYWLFRNFALRQSKVGMNFKTLKEKLEVILRKEDEVLYDHLRNTNAFEALPVELWFGRYFSEVLHENFLPRIFDKIIGGNCTILPYVGVAILLIQKHMILSTTDSVKIVGFLDKIPEEMSDIIVNKSLDLYYS